MKKWDQFFPDLLPDLPGCPDPMLERALMRASQKFFAHTKLWRIWLDPITTVLDATVYDLNLEPHSEIVRLERATLDGREIDVTTEESMPADWMTSTAGISTCIFTTDRKTVYLLPAQAAGLVLLVQSTLKPSDKAQGIEDAFFDQYAEVIAKGAKARLLQSALPFANPTYGMSLEDEFDEEVASIAFQSARGFSSAMPRARLKTF